MARGPRDSSRRFLRALQEDPQGPSGKILRGPPGGSSGIHPQESSGRALRGPGEGPQGPLGGSSGVLGTPLGDSSGTSGKIPRGPQGGSSGVHSKVLRVA